MVIRLHFCGSFCLTGESFLASFQRRLLLFAISLNYLQKPLPAELYNWFKQQTAKNFWRSNQLGLLQMAILLLLWDRAADLQYILAKCLSPFRIDGTLYQRFAHQLFICCRSLSATIFLFGSISGMRFF